MSRYEPAVILSACRTPIGSFGGALKDVSAVDLGARVIREAICRGGVDPAYLKKIEDGVYLVTDLIEKPSPEEAPSNLAIIGRYILVASATPAPLRCCSTK